MAVPQVIDTNLDEQQADDLKAELDLYLQQEAPHNPFININRGSCYNLKAVDSHKSGTQLGRFSFSPRSGVQPLLPVIFAVPTSLRLCSEASDHKS